MINLEVELTDSYYFEKINEDTFTVHFKVPKSLSYFNGHFPHFPVMPAVAQVDITSFFINKLILKSEFIHVNKIDSVRIKAAVRPEQQIQLNITKLNETTFRTSWKTNELEPKEIADLTILF